MDDPFAYLGPEVRWLSYLRLNRSLHRKVKGSANRAKAKTKLARLHNRISNVRNEKSRNAFIRCAIVSIKAKNPTPRQIYSALLALAEEEEAA